VVTLVLKARICEPAGRQLEEVTAALGHDSTGLTIPPALLFHRPYYSTGLTIPPALLRSSMMRFLLMAQV